ncbi:CvpA family protein [Echinicola vietnamensis]|uniref:Putative membrane protein, required for colicin V production n=1 Tax=Echinicola vietnamensis (strain DSM 17526 / LMG 23754 / KMM 6221) TaxID=926556 RepID=L0FUF5_ECHVK|nr:CvpA family protein [Echinicola vietnamensis]AGA76937.1 putative membrane protein, required for colicin V production [Echinicola vietnamensis DSM 17526]
MNTIDIVILILLAIGAYSGYRQGLFIGILSIVAFIIGLVFAFKFMHWGAELLATRVESLTFMLPFISFLIIFLLVTITIRILALLVKKTLDLTILGTFDNFAGAILGLLKWGFMLSLLIWAAKSFGIEMPREKLEESYLFTVIEPFAAIVIDMVGVITPAIQDAVGRINELVEKSQDAVAN